jgi:hypothetical protein
VKTTEEKKFRKFIWYKWCPQEVDCSHSEAELSDHPKARKALEKIGTEMLTIC